MCPAFSCINCFGKYSGKYILVYSRHSPKMSTTFVRYEKEERTSSLLAMKIEETFL
jgi:hypothetical protein